MTPKERLISEIKEKYYVVDSIRIDGYHIVRLDYVKNIGDGFNLYQTIPFENFYPTNLYYLEEIIEDINYYDDDLKNRDWFDISKWYNEENLEAVKYFKEKDEIGIVEVEYITKSKVFKEKKNND